jgi:hypothetical protein
VRQAEMDEAQLVFVGSECESNTPKIVVLDFGRIQPFFQNELKSEILPFHMDFNVFDYIPQEAKGLSIERYIPFGLRVPLP